MGSGESFSLIFRCVREKKGGRRASKGRIIERSFSYFALALLKHAKERGKKRVVWGEIEKFAPFAVSSRSADGGAEITICLELSRLTRKTSRGDLAEKWPIQFIFASHVRKLISRLPQLSD